MSFLAHVLLLLCAQRTAPAPPPAGSAEAGEAARVRGNGVELIVDDRIVTSSQVASGIQRLASRVVVSTREEQLQLIRAAQDQAAKSELYVQAGAELGHPSDEIQARVQGLLGYYREDVSDAFRRYVDEANARGRSVQATARDDMLRDMWLGTVTGSFEGVGNRLWADNYIRPGQALETYRSRAELIEQSGRVQFQRLVITGEGNGGVDVARRICEQLRDEILGGADFGEQVLLYGLDQGTRGVLEPQEARTLDPELARFGLQAAIGDLSPVLPAVEPEHGLVGYQVLKLLDRAEPAPQPPFTQPEHQATLFRMIREETLDYLVGEAGEELLRNAYIRPPGAPPALEPAEPLP